MSEILCQTTVQVSNYFKSNSVQLGFDKIVARAPKRSPTPEPAVAWKEPKQAIVPVPPKTEALSLPQAGLNLGNELAAYMPSLGDPFGISKDAARQLPSQGNTPLPRFQSSFSPHSSQLHSTAHISVGQYSQFPFSSWPELPSSISRDSSASQHSHP